MVQGEGENSGSREKAAAVAAAADQQEVSSREGREGCRSEGNESSRGGGRGRAEMVILVDASLQRGSQVEVASRGEIRGEEEGRGEEGDEGGGW